MQMVVEGISYQYWRQERPALDDIHFTIPEGSYTALIGPTGSGKSTLLHILGGLLRPTAGRVRLGKWVLDSKSKNLVEYRRHIGMIFQNPEYQLFAETVEKDIAYGLRQLGYPESEIKERVEQAIKWLGLPLEWKTRSPFQLSWGQMRKVALAGVFAMKPKVLLLDEPTAGLDALSKKRLRSWIKEWRQREACTVVHVTHDMNEVADFADQVVVLYQGRLVLKGTPGKVFEQPDQLKKVGLDIPDITKLIIKLNQSLTPPIPLNLTTLKQLLAHLEMRRSLSL